MTPLRILETEHTTIEQSSGYRIPGYLIVQPKAACTRLGEMSQEASTDLFACISLAENLVHEIIQPVRVYVMKFAEMNPQVHFHIFPRTVDLEKAYLAQADDKPPINGARATDWTWAHHESLGYSDAQIDGFVHSAREWVRLHRPT
jgi:diadenosine tetraphosphate (Ap4A) HIT family hydrolase